MSPRSLFWDHTRDLPVKRHERPRPAVGGARAGQRRRTLHGHRARALDAPHSRFVPLLVTFVALGSFEIAANGDSPSRGAVFPVFTIAKSENKNQVQYGIRLDDHCAPAGPAPVIAYWRMLEQGPTETAPILPRELRAYGLASQTIVARDASGGSVRAVLNALPRRPVTLTTSRATDGTCRAVAIASIAGTPAHLFNVFVQLKWDGVAYLLLRGWSTDGSHVVSEKLTQ